MRNLTLVTLAGFLLIEAGCGGKNPRGSASLSVRAKAVTPPAAAAPDGGLDLGAGITLTRVRLALREIGLEGGAAAASAASVAVSARRETSEAPQGADDEEPGEVKVGPFLVDLSGAGLSGGALAQVFDAEVPAGTYRELRIVVGPVDPSGATSALANLNGNSVVVSGSIDGAPFTFSSRLVSAQKRESTVVVAPGSGSKNVTLTVSPAAWFKAADGSRLDPTVDANRAAIEDNLRASIDAFDDDDRDGTEDHHGADDGSGHS